MQNDKKELIEKLKEFNDNDELVAETEVGAVEVNIELHALKFKSVLRRNINDYGSKRSFL